MTHQPRVRLLLSPLLLLVAILTTLSLATPSTAAASRPETRVRAIPTATAAAVGQPSSETAGGVGKLRPPQADLVSATGVATNTADDLVRLGTKDSWGNLNTLDDHFARHGADFGATSADDYARQASEFLQQPGTLTKIDPKTGVIRVYDPATETFGAYNPTGTTRTFYIPDPAKHGYPTNLDYWNAQPG